MTQDRPARRAAAADLEAFAAHAAHQLGEAVALIRGSTVVLESQGGRLGPAASDALRGMSAGVDRAQRYVEDLLDVTQAASADLAPESVDLGRPLAQVREQLEPAFARARAQLRTGPLPQAWMDPRQAERLFVHLMRAPLAAGARTIAVSGTAEDGAVTLDVADDGTAPEPEAAAALLEPFARPRGRGPLVGAGVSLSVCRLVAERHGGTLAVEVRDGATVTRVTLPAQD
jgi:signal transduction histidine kinase